MATLASTLEKSLNVTSWFFAENVHRVLIDVGLVKQGCELRIELRRADELLRGHNWKGHNGIGEKKERKKQGRRKKPERLDTGLEGHSTFLGRGARTCPKVRLLLDLRVTALAWAAERPISAFIPSLPRNVAPATL